MLFPQQADHRLFHALHVHAVHILTQLFFHMGDDGLQHLLRLFPGLRLGGHLQKAVALLGVGGHGGICHGVHLVPEHLVHRALPQAENAQGVGDDLPVGKLLQIGDDAGAEHGVALLGRAGEHDDRFPVLFKGAARGGAPFVVKYRAALRQHGLLEVVGGEHSASLDILVQALILRLVPYQLQAEGSGQDLLGQIVAGGAQAAGGDDDIRPLLCHLHAVLQPLGVVPYHGVIAHVDADFGQHFGDVPGVGVGHMAQKQLCAHRKYFRIVCFTHGQA